MSATSSHGGDVVTYFWNAYFEWRASHALNDACMLELVAAIRAEINSGVLSGVEVVRLKKLARMIEVQLIAERADCRAA
jgi:hypothetical protein